DPAARRARAYPAAALCPRPARHRACPARELPVPRRAGSARPGRARGAVQRPVPGPRPVGRRRPRGLPGPVRELPDRGDGVSEEHDHQPTAPMARRVATLERLLEERGALKEGQVDDVEDVFCHRMGTRNGARYVARAWVDGDFRRRLLDDATAVVRTEGYD